MAATVSSSHSRALDARDVRALVRQPAVPGQKQEFLRALVGSMSEQEVAALEERINRTTERVDDGGPAVP